MLLLRLTGGFIAVLSSKIFFLKLHMTSTFFKERFNSSKIPAKNIAVKYHLEICGKLDIKQGLGIPIAKHMARKHALCSPGMPFLFLVPQTPVFL